MKKPLNISIRHAQIEDAHSIAEAEREIAKEPGFFCSQPFELSDQNVERMISEFLQTKKGVYFVATYENVIVGHAFLEPFSLQSLQHVAQLNIAVHQGWQEKGIGTQLIQKILAWTENSPLIERIELNVRASNARAISLYKKMGFHEEGRLKKRVKTSHHYFDDVIMALEVKKSS